MSPEPSATIATIFIYKGFANPKMPSSKFIVITGGVISGLGKGILTASIGNLLKGDFRVVPVKCDGYLNVDPGTMNPIEHGEVFVLDDGGEVDMDFGHYERFMDVACKFSWNLTMGKVFERIREKERRGDYLGRTVQLIPHVPDLVLDWWFEIADEENADIVLIEVGGTVGDVENELYIEAARRIRERVGQNDVLYVHLTYVPIPHGVNEQKSKPTQQSVNLLRQRGITPDIIVGRCSEPLAPSIKSKIAGFCDVSSDAVLTSVDVDTIYKIPLILETQGFLKILQKKFGLVVTPDHNGWQRYVSAINKGSQDITIAICGKYTSLEDSYASIIEALMHASAHYDCNIHVRWVDTTDEGSVASQLADVHGVIVPGGFGTRGIEGKIHAIRECREDNRPFLGICYGLQLAVVEFARNVCGIDGAHTTEVDPATRDPVVCILPEQRNVTRKGGTMRLGAYPAALVPGSLVSRVYGGAVQVSERHRHRFEVNPDYHDILTKKGLVFSGMSPDRRLAEFIELRSHPYFVGTQAHPELKSTLVRPAPLFSGLVAAALEQARRTSQTSATPNSSAGSPVLSSFSSEKAGKHF